MLSHNTLTLSLHFGGAKEPKDLMQTTPAAIQPAALNRCITAAQDYLLSAQNAGGYWWADLESNVSITAEVVLLHHVWQSQAWQSQRFFSKAKTYLLKQQCAHGGWELFYGDGGDLSTSVEAYMALRLLDVTASDPALVSAKAFILSRGGISKTRIFTKFHLALIGCYDWRGLPSLPAWIMLLEHPFPVNIYELSSWARGSTVPLLVVFDQKPIYPVSSDFNLNELYAEGIENVRWELPEKGDWSDAFVWLDKGFKLAESLNLVPLREESIRRAEKWVVERQEATGDWGGIIPAMLNSLLALRSLSYDLNNPMVQRGLKAIDNFAVETEETYWVQSCISPVWDTALSMRALTDSDLAADHPALVKAGEWLLNKQIFSYGDWVVKNPQGAPGGWAFEFENRFYPDVDDTAVVAMALQEIVLPNEKLKKAAIARAARWIATMQCRTGGWAAFDIDNDQSWLNEIPYGDLKAMIDPSTADVTARVLEMHGRLKQARDLTGEVTGLTESKISAALKYLVKEQESDGSWFGRWGVNYIYGTSGALSALAQIDASRYRPQIELGVNWLLSYQNTDGGWGETCRSYDDPRLKGTGPSTASQTAWALLGLLDAVCFDAGLTASTTLSIRSGIQYLLNTQTAEGTWQEAEFTGTGFPSHFYIRYHLYRHHFPLMALGRYRRTV
jgi:squalene-hopene/tetraprenyl-beta-curcumene cyclase